MPVSSQQRTVLVTGGAGYIGSVLTRLLLADGFNVRVLDNLRFGGTSLVDLLNHPGFSFVKGDIRDEQTIAAALEGVNAVANLAAIVGDPACAKEPELARETNLDAVRQLYVAASQAGVEQFVMASTCSNYGKMSDPDALVDESSELLPVSLYAETKVAAEQFLLRRDNASSCKPTCLRFATVYGLSPRMRFDLTVNEFTRELALGRELVIFGEQFWRPYCHVVDLARSVVQVLNAPVEKVAFEVFNVGDSEENYQKQMIVDEICRQLPESRVRYVSKDEDPRDYRVSFDKIRQELDFTISKRVPDGIAQIITVLQQGLLTDADAQKYRNI